MTRRPAYPGQAEQIRGIGVIHSGADQSIKGTKPGSSSKALQKAIDDDAEAAVKQLMRAARHRLATGGTIDVRVSRSGVVRRRKHGNSVSVDAQPKPLPDEMPAIEEWDNPFVKPRRERHEQLHSAALRRARIEAASDPDDPVIRAWIIRRDESTCWICKKLCEAGDIHLDHVLPITRGGKHVPENIRVACTSCNQWHGNRIIRPL